jgi:hypothetical protein
MTRKIGWLVTALFVFMAFSLSTSTLNAADCPPAGSGAAGVAEWAAVNVGSECENPATTCNGEFTIELIDVSENGDLMTFEYQVCQVAGQNALSHFIIAPQIVCGVTPVSLGSIMVGATVNGEDVIPVVGLDPTTQVDGIKVETPESECYEIALTFDTSLLPEGYTLGVGCTLATTKAGNQDIQRSNRATPGYASVQGPVCVLEGEEACETAFAYADEAAGGECFLNLGFNRWGWTIALPEEGEYSFPVYAAAGQCDLTNGTQVGNVLVVYSDGQVTAILELDAGYYATEEHLYAGSTAVPNNANTGNPTVAPGQYYVEDDLTGPIYVIVHAVVCGVY